MLNETLIKEGTFPKIGNKIMVDERVLLIKERKNNLQTKTKLFLVALKSFNSPFQYISSLFNLSENKYLLEFAGKNYLLELQENAVKMQSYEVNQ